MRLLPAPEVLAEVPTPALLIHLPRVRLNVARVLELTGGPERWRPHLKTTKAPAVWRELLAAGLRAFKCATVREAEVLCELVRAEGIGGVDLALAYPLLEPGLSALAELAREQDGVALSILVEDEDSAAALPAPLTAFVDVDSGMHRTGLSVDDAGAIERVAARLGERFRGVHFYEGHLHAPEPAARRAEVHAALDRAVGLVEHLRAAGLAVGELITSGTPAFHAALSHPGVARLEGTLHRVSPGTVVFHDGVSERENPELGLRPAAVVLSRVVSRPSPTLATLDAGSKAVSTDAGHPCCAVVDHPELVPRVPSEEHLPLAVPADAAPRRGELFALVPLHVCPTVNLHDRALLVDGDAVAWTPIAARGH